MSNKTGRFLNLNWLSRFKKTSNLKADAKGFPPPQKIDFTPLKSTRFVVIDLETTGLNIHKDQIIAVGAVVIENNEIQLTQSFERTIFRELNKVDDTVLIHGISPNEVASGEPAEAVLAEFMAYTGESVFLAYHAPFDQGMLTRALKRDLGLPLKHTFFDVADIAAALLPSIEVGRSMQQAGLDDWVNHFGLNVSNRHNASADALATAEIMLILLREAEKQAIDTLAQLAEKIKGYKRLRIMKR
ncbi:3'-5' exonuclease [Alkalimarinus alittae]|uniref:DNA-directed DNA polymerase n=1 Tax=Alkalimarinus alittae TaxID=2961619 RepID=A0ABY6N5D7_9ALTE|nr:3'-5' exonuclease [Alkalimarinus alittae]UZE97326.1 3'-5' exonuclease [Alkalimarinus alittae]